MPYYRRRKRPIKRRRKRVYHKRRYKRYRSVSNPILTTVQKFSRLQNIPAAGGAPTFETGQEIFTLSDCISNVGNFTRLFRLYRLLGVKVTFIPIYNGAGVSTDPQPQLLIAGNIMTSITRDSNKMAPTTAPWSQVDQAEQESNLVKKYLTPQTGGRSTHVVKFKPSLNNWVRTSAGSATNSTVTMAQGKPWISTGTPGQEYFGLKWAYENTSTSHPAFDMEIRFSYIFQFKGVA